MVHSPASAHFDADRGARVRLRRHQGDGSQRHHDAAPGGPKAASEPAHTCAAILGHRFSSPAVAVLVADASRNPPLLQK